MRLQEVKLEEKAQKVQSQETLLSNGAGRWPGWDWGPHYWRAKHDHILHKEPPCSQHSFPGQPGTPRGRQTPNYEHCFTCLPFTMCLGTGTLISRSL